LLFSGLLVCSRLDWGLPGRFPCPAGAGSLPSRPPASGSCRSRPPAGFRQVPASGLEDLPVALKHGLDPTPPCPGCQPRLPNQAKGSALGGWLGPGASTRSGPARRQLGGVTKAFMPRLLPGSARLPVGGLLAGFPRGRSLHKALPMFPGAWGLPFGPPGGRSDPSSYLPASGWAQVFASRQGPDPSPTSLGRQATGRFRGDGLGRSEGLAQAGLPPSGGAPRARDCLLMAGLAPGVDLVQARGLESDGWAGSVVLGTPEPGPGALWLGVLVVSVPTCRSDLAVSSHRVLLVRLPLQPHFPDRPCVSGRSHS
jgi:hypothetical protein